MAGNLSGGEQQMLALGGALMTRPHLLLIDELSLGPGARRSSASCSTWSGRSTGGAPPS